MECRADGEATHLAVHWSVSGHFTGAELFGAPATGAPLHLHWATMLELKGAMIVRALNILDVIEMQAWGYDVACSQLLQKVALHDQAARSPAARRSFLDAITARFQAVFSQMGGTSSGAGSAEGADK